MDAVRRSAAAPTFVGGPPWWNPRPPCNGGVRSHPSSEALVGVEPDPASVSGLRASGHGLPAQSGGHRARRRALATSDAGFALSDSARFVGQHRADSGDRGSSLAARRPITRAARREWQSPHRRGARSQDRRASGGGSPRAIPWPSARRAAVAARTILGRGRCLLWSMLRGPAAGGTLRHAVPHRPRVRLNAMRRGRAGRLRNVLRHRHCNWRISGVFHRALPGGILRVGARVHKEVPE